ncbi:MAG: hypothetical protein QW275_02530 [Candidatus Anstonellaceae archaeon]
MTADENPRIAEFWVLLGFLKRSIQIAPREVEANASKAPNKTSFAWSTAKLS